MNFSVLIFPALPKRERFLTHKVVEEEFEDLCSFSLGGVLRRTAVCLKSRLIFAFNNGFCLDEAVRKVAVRLCREKGLPVDFLSHSIKRPPPSSREMQAPRPARQRQRRPDIQLYVPRGRKAEALKPDARDAPAQAARVPSQHLLERRAPLATTDAAEALTPGTKDAPTQAARVPSPHLSERQAPFATTDAAEAVKPDERGVPAEEARMPAPHLPERQEPFATDAAEVVKPDARDSPAQAARVPSPHLPESQAPFATTGAAGPRCIEDTGYHRVEAHSGDIKKTCAQLNELTNACGMDGDADYTGQDLDSNCDVLSTSGNSDNGEGVIQVCLSLSQENDSEYIRKAADECSQEVNSLQEFPSIVTDSAGTQKRTGLQALQGSVGIAVDDSVVRTSESTQNAAHEEPSPTSQMEMAQLCGEHVDTGGDSTETSIGESHKDAEDSWDALFDETGECVDPEVLKNITKALGDIKVHQAELDYTKFEPRIPDVSEEEYGHVLEMYDFPAEFETKDLVTALSSCRDQFNIKWVDDTHALAIFSTPFAATEALSLQNSLMKMRHVSEASKQSKLKIKHCSEFLMPYKPRPQTSASVARRLVSGALGMRVKVDVEQRRKELQILKEAKGKRKTAAKQRADVWNGDVS
ncbi:R3H and coiled-coil domain-containing protein 1 isoform X2 [Rhipicephalus sanguineus]|uniref:R3H and coiled-coil domain-containing protein 1 isoform X2 n=1 Tax=Rhipicephalus sanguineus TaxID=34632 RepID=UPI001893C34E|nr:R3H and coiled-coil domain-containing protein 1 isoform X2 [Rhipicephalus sanguineus]